MAINLRDYSRTAAQRGWGAGWPTCSGVKDAGTAVVTAARSGTRMSVHKRIARLVGLLLDETERRRYLLKPGKCGGYNCRAIGGTQSPSNHSWGLAVDLNWGDNPMRRPLTTDIPAWMPALWNRYGFAWGGHYTGTADPMHFEFMGAPADADAMTALALKDLGAPTPEPTTDGPRTLRLTDPAMVGDDVRLVQLVLAAWYGLPATWADGRYGPLTVEYVKRAQANTPPEPKLEADGVVGQLTRQKLGIQ